MEGEKYLSSVCVCGGGGGGGAGEASPPPRLNSRMKPWESGKSSGLINCVLNDADYADREVWVTSCN